VSLPPFNRDTALILAGGGMFALVVFVLAIITLRPELADNDLFKSLAQAIVIQGLIGLVVAGLFTGTGRRKDDP
jgi:hypothetical protein